MIKISRTTSPWLVVVAFFAVLRMAQAIDDEWPQYGHDQALTGRTSLKGDISSPQLAWSISLSGEQIDLEVRPSTCEHTTELDGTTVHPDERTIAVPGPTLVEIDDSESEAAVVERYDRRWAKILPDTNRLQRISWNRTGTTAKISRLQLFSYEEGYDRPHLVWESEAEATVMRPLCVVYDIDRDGVQEVCVALHYRVIIYEGTTGRKETELRFHTSRSYGWFGLADVDADDQMELIVLSDFQSHFDVLDFDPDLPESERLSVKWRREVEQRIELREKWPQIGPRPLVDVTGDNRPEIVLNLFNDHGDEQWHVVVMDSATGSVLYDLPNRYTHGTADIDTDGKAEIFCTTTSGVLVPRFGTAQIIRLAAGEDIIWSQSLASFGSTNLPRFGPMWTTSANQGVMHVSVTEHELRPAFLVISRDVANFALTTVSAIHVDAEGEAQSLWQVTGLPDIVETVVVSELDEGVGALLRMQLPNSANMTVAGRNALPVVVARSPLGTAPFAPIVSRLNENGPMAVVVQGAAEIVYCLRGPHAEESAPVVLWQRTGRGIGNYGSPGTTVAVDLNGDGVREIIFASRTVTGSAVLNSYHSNGDLFWQHIFDQTSGDIPSHNINSLLYWWPGHFRDGNQFDLFVNSRRGLMHSGVGYLLDGKTGTQVWTHRRAYVPEQFTWGYSGAPIAAADLLDDGHDQIVNLFPVCFWLGDGATGEIVVAQELASRKMLPAWAAYGEPMVYDFDGDGHLDVLLDSPYLLGVLDRYGQPMWNGKPVADYPTGKAIENVGEATSVRHALVDFDGDGQMEIASGGYRDGVRAIDPRDGTILWTLDAPTPNGKCAAADINGDGGDELIFVAGSNLIAVTGDRTTGQILWSWHGPAELSLPAIADVDGDGKAEIVVQSKDGAVHCIDGYGSQY